MKLQIAHGLSLPLDAVTQTLAAIGRKGAGKTYLATKIAEEMLDAGAQVVAIDPVGNWWGLRVGADGKSKGKEIFVLGGEHGDVPLTPEAGARIAQLLVERNVSAVLDVSAFRMGERKRFAADFGEELFHRKKSQRSPMHLFVEEAQLFAPQRSGPDEARMLGAFESIVRLGRNYGIGATLVTQRPQSVNKEVLSQVECLCVLQVNGTHERKALEEWVQEAGADRKLVGELPGLQRGEGYVWSPSWLRMFERVRFSAKTTFDASATPEVGKAAKAAKLSEVDVAALRADMSEVVAAAEKDDPKALRRRIAELERELAKKPVAAPTKVWTKTVERWTLRKGEAERLERIVERAREAAALAAQGAEGLAGALARANLSNAQPPQAPASAAARHIERRSAPPRATNGATPPDASLDKAQRAILAVLAQHPEGCAAGKLTLLAGYRWSGGFRNALAALRTSGLVDGPNTGTMRATDAGVAAAGDWQPLPSGQALVDYWMRHPSLGACERAVLGVLIHTRHGLALQELAERAGYERSGGLRNALSNLRTAGLLVGRNTETMRPSEMLFGEG